jgi:uncharacterized protein (TIGR02001 family)
MSTAPAARAELGGTVSVQSDARERGLSYSRDNPSAQLTLSYDGSAGWYGGGLLTRVDFAPEHGSALVRGYVGRVMGLVPGIDAEAGLQYSHFASITRYDFAEAYAGLLGERWSARLHYANDYYGNRQRSLYGEVNFNWPLNRSLTAVAHAGALTGPRSDYRSTQNSTRYDGRLGLAWQLQPIELQLSWVTVSNGGPYTWMTESRRNTVVLGISASF